MKSKISSTVFNQIRRSSNISENGLILNRKRMIERLKLANGRDSENSFDILVIGGGATGSGAALDAAQRGLKVACVEREDFSSGTSSRSTKLIWGGSRYLVQAFVSLFNFDLRLFRRPKSTVQRFIDDIKMVMSTHRERKFLLLTQPHLAYWLPIAVPLTSWIQWPPPFGFPPASIGPLGLYPLFFKLYDALSGFTCPPSHIMTPSRARRKFPQLVNSKIKYCPVFYEGMHDDARTNLAIAQTAGREGGIVANYCEVVELIRENDSNKTTNNDEINGTDVHHLNKDSKVVGVIVKDMVTLEQFPVFAKCVMFCGGPFTDSLRRLEDPSCTNVVTGASGIHIVIPSYYAPTTFGLVDMNTSDGRFLFFLPWQGHVIVGTTDHQCEPNMRPIPDESEIQWLLTEASKYLQPELRLRRQDVLSAWSGIRPLAFDPHENSNAAPGKTASASRDHIISVNPKSGIIFVAGGKWTTYREMAEDAIDKAIEVVPELNKSKHKFGACNTLKTKLVGLHGYCDNFAIRLIQKYRISLPVANHLVHTYGGRAYDVLNIATNEDESGLKILIEGFPYIQAEVTFAVRHDWAIHAEDIIARRLRIAFLDKEKTIKIIPKVIKLMSKELQWDEITVEQEIQSVLAFMKHIGGPHPLTDATANYATSNDDKSNKSVRMSTLTDLLEVFNRVIDTSSVNINGVVTINRSQVLLASEMLNHPLSVEALDDCMNFSSENVGLIETMQQPQVVQRINFEQFSTWWNSENYNPGLTELKKSKIAAMNKLEGSGALFG
eukprot:gene5774-7972_t